MLPGVASQWTTPSGGDTGRKMTRWVPIAAISCLMVLSAMPANVLAEPEAGPSKAQQEWFAERKRRVAEGDRCSMRAMSSVLTCSQAFGAAPDRPATTAIRDICLKYGGEEEKLCQGVKSDTGKRHLSKMTDVNWRTSDPRCAVVASYRAAVCLEIVEGSVKRSSPKMPELRESCINLGNAVAAQCSVSGG